MAKEKLLRILAWIAGGIVIVIAIYGILTAPW